ncbi:unnamed protein product [Dracunculus medinensis]|uniref:L-Fucosyltransferase n=1 Tax=Dracunculus medinensis TaxID=318479 RepID=A0A0N4UL17_DRAME|nr:unnamed protein product [Dracunculus medinensis]
MSLRDESSTLPGISTRGDVRFDQPWSLPQISVIMDINELSTQSQRYLISNFSYSPGLGNIMFQYAAMKSLSIKYNARIILPESCKLRRAFQLNATYLSDDLTELLIKNLDNRKIDFKECCKYQQELMNGLFSNASQNIELLTGYFQTFRYFHPEEEKRIREEFTFLPEIKKKAERYLQLAKSERLNYKKDKNNNYVFIGVHVRHGIDITMNSRNYLHGHIAANPRYFSHAMDYYRTKYRNLIFMISSDNEYWTKKYIKGREEGEVFILSTGYREVDLAVLSVCEHIIMSTGTFSWWAAYLAGGSAIYYKNWPANGSILEKMVEKKDYFLENWMPMS